MILLIIITVDNINDNDIHLKNTILKEIPDDKIGEAYRDH